MSGGDRRPGRQRPVAAALIAATVLVFPGPPAKGDATVAKSAKESNPALEHYPDAVLSASGEGFDVSVASDGHTLEAREDQTGRTAWSLDVLTVGGPPATGFPVIRHVEIAKRGTVSVVVGKNLFVDIELKSGKVQSLGED